MVTALRANELYESSAKFAQSALDAHHKGDHQRVAIDAGTSLGHLTKACLANRSPALLVELKPGNWESLALLCGHSQPQLKQLRTVGLREACARVRTFVSSQAAKDALGLLISLRDGVVHAAVDKEVEERLLVAFVQQADAILADMNVPRYEFWGAQSEVVDALLSTASDKVAHRVQVKLASAKAAFIDRFADMSAEIRELVVTTEPRYNDAREAIRDCPVCGSKGIAGGTLSLVRRV
jgi:hypothetical protein